MDKDFARDIDYMIRESKLKSFVYRDAKIIEYLSEMDMNGAILDIGERNPLTERIEEAFGIKVDSTVGDLDDNSSVAKIVKYAPYQCHTFHDWDFGYYNVVIFSHVIEHLFNPLLCLENIKSSMDTKGTLIICTPIKPHFIRWGKGHFHEFDDYRFKKLIERAGLKIIRWEKFSNRPLFCDIGIRPILRKVFFREQSFVVLKCIK